MMLARGMMSYEQSREAEMLIYPAPGHFLRYRASEAEGIYYPPYLIDARRL